MSKTIRRVKSNIFHAIIVPIQYSEVSDIRESTFFKKVSVTRILSESTVYIVEMNALEEDPIDGDQDGSQYFSITKQDKRYYSIECCVLRDS